MAGKNGGGKQGAGKGNRGRGGRGGGAPTLEQQAQRAARQQVRAASRPIHKDIASERAANLRAAQQQIGFAKAAAALSQAAAPRVQDTYSGAANADAGYARGLGDATQGAINQQASSSNDFLSKMGTPTAGLVHPADVGGTAYGLEGYIPATTLQREGAAFGAAAQMLPSDILAQGQRSATTALNNNTNIAKLQSELTDLASKEPAIQQSILSGYHDQQYKNAELNLSNKRLGLEAVRTQASIQQGNERLQIEAQRAAQTTLNENRSYRLSLSRLGLESKRLQMEAVKSEISLRNGGLSQADITRDHSIAFGLASQAFHSQDANTHKPITYGEALSTITEKGIPLSIAINALHHAGFTAGVRGAPRGDHLSSPSAGNGLSWLTNLNGIIHGLGGSFKSAAESGAAHAIVNMAHQYIGTPYVWGGTTPKGFDCSGFAQYLYGKVGISIPRDTYDQWKAGRAVGKGQLEPGDLVFFRGSDSRGGLPGHVGVYIGGGLMIDAPHTGASVRIEKVDSFGGYQGARRYGKG